MPLAQTMGAGRCGEAPPNGWPSPTTFPTRPDEGLPTRLRAPSLWEAASDNRQRVDGDPDFVLCILGMKMWWRMIGEVHLDHDAVEAADLRHWRSKDPPREPLPSCQLAAGTSNPDRCRSPGSTQLHHGHLAEPSQRKRRRPRQRTRPAQRDRTDRLRPQLHRCIGAKSESSEAP